MYTNKDERILLLEEKGKQSKLQKSFVQKYSWETVYNQEKSFSYTSKDLKDLFDIINECVFDSKLGEVDIIINSSLKSKGAFGFQNIDDDNNVVSLKNPPLIEIKKESTDTFLEVVDALAHEMIHFYDFMFGPLCELKMQSAHASADGRQLVGAYDVHGTYFQKWTDVFYEEGFYVCTKHYAAMKYLMLDEFWRPMKMDGTVIDENKVEESKDSQLDVLPTDKPITKFAKTLFKSIKSDGYFSVEVRNNKCYVIME